MINIWTDLTDAKKNFPVNSRVLVNDYNWGTVLNHFIWIGYGGPIVMVRVEVDDLGLGNFDPLFLSTV